MTAARVTDADRERTAEVAALFLERLDDWDVVAEALADERRRTFEAIMKLGNAWVEQNATHWSAYVARELLEAIEMEFGGG